MGHMVVLKKRVLVVMDEVCGRATQTMMWALKNIANKGDILTLMHVVSPRGTEGDLYPVPQLLNSHGAFCKACKPEVEVEVLVVQGDKLLTVLTQVKKLEVSVLVLSQRNPSMFSLCCLNRSKDCEFVEQCINRAECLTLSVKKQSKGTGGYLVSTKWHKNFWLLA